jgi:ankyrin repeat protein
VEKLLEQGANVNAKDRDGETALMWAARRGHSETVKALINAGADVNVKGGRYSKTALMWAEAWDHSEIAEILKQAGAEE